MCVLLVAVFSFRPVGFGTIVKTCETGKTQIINKVVRRLDGMPAFALGDCISQENWTPIWKITKVGNQKYVTKVVKEATDGDSPYRVGSVGDRFFSLTDDVFNEVACP
jgi:hypothetical protein